MERIKVLIANSPSPYIRCRWDIKYEKTAMQYLPFPTRLAYATAVLKREGFDAHIIDGLAEEISRQDFVQRVKEMKPDLLVWETTASSFDYDLKTLEMVRKAVPKIKVSASGYHASATSDHCLKSGYDFVVVGECDYSILDLARYLSGELKGFPKGVVAKNHKLIRRPLIKNIDELPWPEREELPIRKYNDPKLYGFNVVLISTRGCPWGCAFCTNPVYYGGPNFRMRSSKDVVNEMEYIWKQYAPDEIYFDDDNFAVNEKHVADICREILKRKMKIRWNCMCDARISGNLMKLMKKSGCSGITIGAESADPKVIRNLGKPITREDIKRFVDDCNKYKLKSHLCWVLGLRDSTKDSDMETIKFALSLKCFSMQFAICMPFPGTKMFDWCNTNDYLISNWKEIKGNDRCIINYPNYSNKEIEENVLRGKKMWHKKMLARPDLMYYHFFNIYRYQGVHGIFSVIKKTLKEQF
jgi:anaerobic magnesium-protoporphyrin IX monomethyl ester cyclase